MTNPIPQYYAPGPMNQDEEHLRLLSIFHYVLAGITAFFGCFPFIHLFVGIMMLSGAFPPGPGVPSGPGGMAFPRFLGLFFVGIASFVILWMWTQAVLMFLAGRNLAKRRSYTFCFVVACIECLQMPMGTVLGIFTIIVLGRASVKGRFGK